MSSNPESSSEQRKSPYVGKPHQTSDHFFAGLLEWCEFSDKEPLIVAITGSTKYEQELREAAEMETAAGHIVLMPHIFRHSPRWKEFGLSQDVGIALDRLFSEFIKMADEVLVVNPNGYIGEGTRNDIACARRSNKPVRFTEQVKPEDVKCCFNPNCNSRNTELMENKDGYWRKCHACGRMRRRSR